MAKKREQRGSRTSLEQRAKCFLEVRAKKSSIKEIAAEFGVTVSYLYNFVIPKAAELQGVDSNTLLFKPRKSQVSTGNTEEPHNLENSDTELSAAEDTSNEESGTGVDSSECPSTEDQKQDSLVEGEEVQNNHVGSESQDTDEYLDKSDDDNITVNPVEERAEKKATFQSELLDTICSNLNEARTILLDTQEKLKVMMEDEDHGR